MDIPADSPEALRVLVTRQPIFPVWADQPVSGFVNGATWRSGSVPAGQANGSVLGLDFTPNLDNAFTGARAAGSGVSPGVGVSGGAIGTLPGSSNSPLVGSVTGRNYLYVPANYITVVVFGAFTGVHASAANAQITLFERNNDEDSRFTVPINISAGQTAGCGILAAVTYDRWLSPFDANMQHVTAAAMQESYQVTLVAVGGSIVYTSSGTSGNHGDIAVTASNVTGMLPLAIAPDFGVTSVPWRACRTTAIGVSFTNISPVFDKSGVILAGRIDPFRLWPWNTSRALVANLHKSDKALASLQSGFYTYVPPSTDIASFDDYAEYNDRQLSLMPTYRLDNMAISHLLFFTNLSGSTQSASVSISWHLEFRNNSTLFPLGVSRITLEVMHQAQLQMMTMGFFHGNDNIPQVLRGAFKGGLGTVRPNVKVQPSKLMVIAQNSPPQKSYNNNNNRSRRNKNKRKVKQNTRPKRGAARPAQLQQPKRKGGLQMYLDSRK
jgi:hypothetical protein